MVSASKRMLPAIGLILVVVVVVRLAVRSSEEARESVPPSSSPAPASDVVSSARGPDPAAQRTLPEDSVSKAAEVASSEPSLAMSPEESKQEDPVLASLRSAIEASVYERIDPAAILAAAQILVALSADQRAIPEPDPTGHLLFPILETPEGVRATLEVARPNARAANILSLNIELDQPASQPLILDGVVREPPKASIMVWTDDEGNVLDVTMMTSIKTDYAATEAIGNSVDSGSVTHGVLYHVNAAGEENFKAYGLRDGAYVSWEAPLLVDGAPCPMQELSGFSRNLLQMYRNVRNQQER